MSGTEAAAGARNRPLIVLNRIVAGLSIGAAILLYTGEKTLGVPGLAAAPHHEPLIVHCLLTALLLLHGNARLRGADKKQSRTAVVLGVLQLFLLPAIALIDLALAGNVVFKFSPYVLPALLLTVPGILCGWTYFAVLEGARENTSPTNQGDIQHALDDSAAAKANAEDPAPSIRGQLLYASIYTALWALVMALLVAGYVYFYMLEDAIFEQKFLGWIHFIRWMQAALTASAPPLLAILIVLFAYVAGAGIFFVRRRRRDQRVQGETEREGTADFAGKSFARLQIYADSVSEKAVFAVVTLGIWLLFAVVLIGGILLIVSRENGLGAYLFERLRTEDLNWYLYIDTVGAGDIVAMFSIILLFGSFWSWLGLVWAEFGAYGILEFRKRKNDAENPWGYYRHALARDLRQGALKPNTEFDAAAYIRQDYKRFVRVWFTLTAILLAINATFLYLDRMDYDLLTEDYIETTDYWTSKVHRLGYGDVDHVEFACSKDDDGDLELSYLLNFADGRTIRAIDFNTPKDFRSILPQRLEAWTKADAKLREAGVKVRHAVREAEAGSRSRFDKAECRAGLDALVGTGVREKVMPLLRETGGRAAAGP